MDSNREGIGTIFILLSATCFGFMAIFAKYAYEDNIGITTILSLRFLLGALFLGAILIIKREKMQLQLRQLLTLIGLGVLGYANMANFYFNSVKLIPASITAVVLYTYPAIVTLLSAWLYKESITKNKIIALFLSFIGLILVVGVVFKGLNLVGVLYAMGAALFYSFYITISSREVNKIPPFVVSFYIILAAGITFLITGLATDSLNFNISPKGWLAVLGTAFISTGIAISTFFLGMKIVGPSKASIISTIEPVVTILAAYLLFSEELTLVQLFGGALILGAVISIHREKQVVRVIEEEKNCEL